MKKVCIPQNVGGSHKSHNIDDTESKPATKRGPKPEALSLHPLMPEEVLRTLLRMPPETKEKHQSKERSNR
jgi:hypothetical protein